MVSNPIIANFLKKQRHLTEEKLSKTKEKLKSNIQSHLEELKENDDNTTDKIYGLEDVFPLLILAEQYFTFSPGKEDNASV